jgi:phosphoribosylaminoimidazolecarboxamide formyltransferase/IMP cyclohydrolase
MTRHAVKTALLSVSDKTGIVELARRLDGAGVRIVSSGGTARTLRDAGLPVTDVGTLTEAPEMLGGRVKTLHPVVHGGILADLGNQEHRDELAARGIDPIGLVVVNLYPFSDTVARDGVTHAEAVEQIDIGGPTMVRAAAKNHAWVGVVTSPDRYDEVATEVEAGGLTADLRLELAKEAFFHTASYDAAIVGWLERDDAERRVLALERTETLRYGENPHQAAGIYREVGAGGWWTSARQLQGNELQQLPRHRGRVAARA